MSTIFLRTFKLFEAFAWSLALKRRKFQPLRDEKQGSRFGVGSPFRSAASYGPKAIVETHAILISLGKVATSPIIS